MMWATCIHSTTGAQEVPRASESWQSQETHLLLGRHYTLLESPEVRQGQIQTAERLRREAEAMAGQGLRLWDLEG